MLLFDNFNGSLLGLTVDLYIDEAKSIKKKVDTGLFELFLWNNLICF